MSLSVQGNIPLPPTLRITADNEGCALKSRTWKSRWNSYATIAKLTKEDEEYQMELFWYCFDSTNLRRVKKKTIVCIRERPKETEGY